MLGDGPIAYDWLVIATGATHAYFGHDEWAVQRRASRRSTTRPDIRRRMLLAFERAEMASRPDLCARLLTFVIVGGGPDRRRDGGRHRRTGAPRARDGLPRDRSEQGRAWC